MPCTPHTSSASSHPSWLRSSTQAKQKGAQRKPINMAAHGRIKPAAGVSVARPPTAPTHAPTSCGLPVWTHSMTIHVTMAILAASVELTSAKVSRLLAATPDPPLKPAPWRGFVFNTLALQQNLTEGYKSYWHCSTYKVHWDRKPHRTSPSTTSQCPALQKPDCAAPAVCFIQPLRTAYMVDYCKRFRAAIENWKM